MNHVSSLVFVLNTLTPRPLMRVICWLFLLNRRIFTADRLKRWWLRYLVCTPDMERIDLQARFARYFFVMMRDSACFDRLADFIAKTDRWKLASLIEAGVRIAVFTELRHRLLRTADHPPPLMEVQIATCVECNLSCPGCYTAGERTGTAPDTARIEWLIGEAELAGAAAIHFIGKGEPFLDETRSLQLIDNATRWPHMLFTIFTNGTHLTPAIADALAKTPNLLCILSVDGPEGVHDSRRGVGTFKQTIKAMGLLGERGVSFAFSCTVTRETLTGATSREFFAAMRKAGCCLGIYSRYFSQMPDRCSTLALAVTDVASFASALKSAQRDCGIPLIDLDALEEHTGCRSRAGLSVYIDGVTGQVMPCLKVPISPVDCRLLGDTMGELGKVLRRPFFEQYRKGQCAGGRWCGANLAAEQRAVDSERKIQERVEP